MPESVVTEMGNFLYLLITFCYFQYSFLIMCYIIRRPKACLQIEQFTDAVCFTCIIVAFNALCVIYLDFCEESSIWYNNISNYVLSFMIAVVADVVYLCSCDRSMQSCKVIVSSVHCMLITTQSLFSLSYDCVIFSVFSSNPRMVLTYQFIMRELYWWYW